YCPRDEIVQGATAFVEQHRHEFAPEPNLLDVGGPNSPWWLMDRHRVGIPKRPCSVEVGVRRACQGYEPSDGPDSRKAHLHGAAQPCLAPSDAFARQSRHSNPHDRFANRLPETTVTIDRVAHGKDDPRNCERKC